MSKVSMRDTKEVIFKRVKELEEELKNQQSSFDPIKEKQEEQKKINKENSEKIIGLNILNDTIVEQYNSINQEIEDKKAELKKLYEIEATANTLAALIRSTDEERAYKEKAIKELEEEYKQKSEEYKKSSDIYRKNLDVQDDLYYTDLKRNRSREEEEYKYNLAKAKERDNDEWEKEKAIREEAIASRERALEEQENEVAELRTSLEKANAELELVPSKISEAVEKAVKETEAKSEKATAIKVNSIKREAEFNKQLQEKEIETLTSSLEELKEEKSILSSKLDEAYAKINDLASKSVVSSQPIYKLQENTK